jgi:hypothetical protein
MAIAGSGAITMDQFHVEAGGTSGDECSINDADIRGLIDKSDGATMAMNEWYGASASFYNFAITNSLRFEDGDNPSLTFTPGSAGNRRTWTWSGWIKRGNLIDGQGFINAGNAPSMGFHENKGYYTLTGVGNSFTQDAVGFQALFRDPSAWYNVVIAFNSTESSAGDRVKYYVNGTQITMSANHISTNAEYSVNNTVEHLIGVSGVSGSTTYFDGYMAEINLIDGTALTPSSFGETKNDIWIPKDTAGLTFGDQGWRLQFKQTGTGTASTSTIGADTSGNNNHWTSNNLVASDVTIDSPTNNFATLNGLMVDPSYPLTLSEGNLKSTQTNKYFSGCSSIVMSKAIGGKWYFEASSVTDGNFPIIAVTQLLTLTSPTYANATGMQGKQYSYHGYDGARRSPPGSGVGSLDGSGNYRTESGWGATFNQDVMSVALDMDNMKVYFAKNGAWQGSGNPAGNANPAFSSLDDEDYLFWLEDGAGADNRDSTWIANFGQDGTFAGTKTAAGNADDNGIGNFLYDVPAGFLSLCTANLPDPVATIDPAESGSPQDYFNTVLYTGAGSGANANTVNTVGFQPDFTWIKNRGDNESHILQDSVMGVANFLQSDTTTQDQDTGGGDIHTFNSAGFILGYTNNRSNATNDSYVAWNWKAGTSFSNDASSTSVGSLDSTGSVNTDVGFSIITWTAVGSSATQTIAHGLGVIPQMIIMKNRDRSTNWAVYHEGIGNTHGLELNTTAAAAADTGWWADTTPTSAVFTTGNGNGYRTGGVAERYIAYCFANVSGYSKFGSYTGNGNTDGPFIYTGFRPAFVIIKITNTTSGWNMQDDVRSPSNPDIIVLGPNFSDIEYTHTNQAYAIDYVSNGFKIRNSTTSWNSNGASFIYMAFAKQPFKYANAR